MSVVPLLLLKEHEKRARNAPASVSKADDIALVTEMRDLMGMPPAQWREALANKPLEPAIIPWGPCASKTEFLRRFEELSGK